MRIKIYENFKIKRQKIPSIPSKSKVQRLETKMHTEREQNDDARSRGTNALRLSPIRNSKTRERKIER